MRKSELNFPHPLLSDYSRDYVEGCSFEIALGDFSEDSFAFTLPFMCTLSSIGLCDMVRNEQAVIAIRVYCSATSYREVFKFSSTDTLTISVPKDKVAKKLELQGVIIAAIDNNSFSLPEHNKSFFSGIKIPIQKGHILAEANPIQINIDDTELEKQLSSIIVIDATAGISALDVQYNNEEDGLIHIQMPEEEYREYFDLRTTYKRYGVSRFLQSAVIIPALTEAILLLRLESIQKEYDPDFEEKYSNTVWADSIFEKCDELKRDLTDESISAFGLANEILRYVTKDTVTELHKKAQEMYNNDGNITRIGGVD